MLKLLANNKFTWTRHWCKFNIVGLLGVILQLCLLKCFTAIGVGYLVATVIAVEITIAHNFFWHEHWTWQERTVSSNKTSDRLSRLVKFNSTTGMVSLIGNLLLMKLFVGTIHLPIILANLLAIASCSTINFLVSDLVVFRKQKIKYLKLKPQE